MNLPIRNKLFLSHLLLVVFIAGTIGVYFYISASQSLLLRLQERLQASAALIGPMIDADEIRHLRGIEDTSRPDYINNLAKLRTLRRMNPDIAYLYVMRQEGEKVYFVLDSDETKDQALPGHEYKHRIPSLLQGFTAMAVDDKIIRDEWGSFLSGYAPIRNSQGEFLVGIDMRADEVRNLAAMLLIADRGGVSRACAAACTQRAVRSGRSVCSCSGGPNPSMITSFSTRDGCEPA